jgi:acyl-CoA thioesterase FadM
VSRAPARDEAAVGPSLELGYRVRFDESTPSGSARTSALVRYAQDCAWAHSERLGFGREWYAARGLFWLVRAVELRLDGTLPTGAIASVTTRVVGFRHVLCRRLTTIASPSGSQVASIDTDWAMVADDGSPTRIPAEFPALLGTGASAFRPHRVALPARLVEAGPGGRPAALTFRVRPQELDPMGHANNAVFLDWLEEAMVTLGEHGPAAAGASSPREEDASVDPPPGSPVGRLPCTYRLEYLLPARPGITLRAEAWRGGPGTIAYRLRDPDGDILRAVVEV